MQSKSVIAEPEEIKPVASAHKAEPDYSPMWDVLRINLRTIGLDPAKTPGRLLDSGILVIKRWKGQKAHVTLYVRQDKSLGLKATFLKSGKSIAAKVSECDVPGYLTLAQYAERMAMHGYLRLRQPPSKPLVENQPAETPNQPELSNTMAAAI